MRTFRSVAGTLLALGLGIGACRGSASSSESSRSGASEPPSRPAPTLQAADLRASCNQRPQASRCSDYSAKAMEAGEPLLRGPCEAQHAMFTYAPCSADSMVGTCEIERAELRHFYRDGPNLYDDLRAKRECEAAHGAWFDPPPMRRH